MTDPIHCEHALVSLCLLEERAMAWAVRAGLHSDWLTDHAAVVMWQNMVESYGKGRWLDSYQYSAKFNLPQHIWQAVEAATVALVPEYIETLRCEWLRRRAKVILEQAQMSVKQPGDIGEILSGIQAAVSDLLDHRPADEPIDEIVSRLIAEWEQPEQAGVVRFPLEALHLGTGSLTDEIVYLLAVESLGKTAFALQTCVCLAHAHVVTSFRSLESGKPKLAQRILSQCAQVNTWRMRTRKAYPDEFDKARRSLDVIRQVQNYLRINDEPATVEQLAAWANCEKSAGTKLLVVDNMKHIITPHSSKSTVEQFRELSLRLKIIRDTTRLPLMILHHSTDEGKTSWSRDISRDADIVICMTEDKTKTILPSAENHWTGRTCIDFEVQKNRDAIRGFTIQAEFDAPHQCFVR